MIGFDVAHLMNAYKGSCFLCWLSQLSQISWRKKNMSFWRICLQNSYKLFGISKSSINFCPFCCNLNFLNVPTVYAFVWSPPCNRKLFWELILQSWGIEVSIFQICFWIVSSKFISWLFHFCPVCGPCWNNILFHMFYVLW